MGRCIVTPRTPRYQNEDDDDGGSDFGDIHVVTAVNRHLPKKGNREINRLLRE